MEQTKYQLRLTVTEPLLGTQPQKDIATEFIQVKAREQGLDVADEQATLPEMLEKGTTVFHKLNGQPIYYDYHIKGFLKESANIQNGMKNEEGASVKALRSKVDNLVFVTPRRIALHVPDGAPITYLERPLRAQTMQGPRVSLARSEMLPVGTWLECEVTVLGVFSEKMLRALLDYGQWKGLGQWRNGSYGRFSYELSKA